MSESGALGGHPKKPSKRVCRERTGVVKCSLKKVLSDSFILDRIEEGVRFYTNLSVWASRFLLFFVLRQLDAGEPLPEFGTTFVRQIITCCAYEELGSRAKFPQNMLERESRVSETCSGRLFVQSPGDRQWVAISFAGGLGRADADRGQELHDHSPVSYFAAVVQVAAEEGQS